MYEENYTTPSKKNTKGKDAEKKKFPNTRFSRKMSIHEQK